MEKNIQTLLFSSLLSFREQRLVGFNNTPEGQKQFDDAAAKVEKSIEDPSKITTELIGEIAQLKVKTVSDDKKTEQLNELDDLNDKKIGLLNKLPEIEKKTALDNPEWQKIQKNLASPEANLKTEAIQAAKKLVQEASAGISEQTDGLNLINTDTNELLTDKERLLIKTRVKLIAAYNKNIENVRAAAPGNKIVFSFDAPPKSEAAGAVALTKLENEGREFISGSFDTLLQKFNTAASAPAKEIARKNIDVAVLKQRQTIYDGMKVVVSENYENADKQIAELLKQLKQMNEVVAAITPAPTAPAEAAGKVVPGATVKGPEAPVAKSEAAGKSVPATAEVPAPEADKALSDKGIEAKKVEALTGAKDDAATGKALEDLNKDIKVEAALKNPADTKIVVDALNKKLESVGSKKRVEVKEGKLVTKEESVVATEAAAKGGLNPNNLDSKETKELKSFFKAILDFIKELAKELGMSPRELLTGQADPAKLNANNAPTKALQTAAEAQTKSAAQNKRLAEEAAGRAKNAPNPTARTKAQREQQQFQQKADEQLRNAGRLEDEAEKAVNKDKQCDKTARKIQDEAKRRGVQADVETTPEKRGIAITPKAGVNPNNIRSFAGDFQQELGAERVVTRGNSIIINYMPNNSGYVQNQINGGDGIQVQGGKAPETPAPRAKEVVPPTPAPSAKEEAAQRPIVVKKKGPGFTGSIQ